MHLLHDYIECVVIAGVTNWPWAEGLYTQDVSVRDCGNGRPSYKQLSGNGIFWKNSGGWHCGTVVCESRNSIIQFYGYWDMVAPGTWYMMNPARITYEPVSSTITVTASSSCGKI